MQDKRIPETILTCNANKRTKHREPAVNAVGPTGILQGEGAVLSLKIGVMLTNSCVGYHKLKYLTNDHHQHQQIADNGGEVSAMLLVLLQQHQRRLQFCVPGPAVFFRAHDRC
jgi:hypothetical protein